MSATGRVLIYGGRGGLGSVCVESFKAKQWQAKQVGAAVQSTLADQKLDAIICVAGGWAGGNAASEDFIKNCDAMWKSSVWTSTIAAQLGSRYLKEDGLLQLTGAKAALERTPGMMGYGMAKAAVHQFVSSLTSSQAGLPPKTTTVAILPITLDTPMNRKNMPGADFSTWTPLSFVANLLVEWSQFPEARPANGSLVELRTQGGSTDLVIGQLQQPAKMANY